jgi:hypothetical protein
MASRAATRVLTDHKQIRQWVEERGGRPAAVSRTASEDDPGILRIDFPGYSGEQSLEEIDWEEFFQKFDEQGLALLVQDETSGGQRSNFNKIISRETARADGRGRMSSSTRGEAARSGSRARVGTTARKSTGRKTSRGRSTPKKSNAARASTGRRKAGANKKGTASARRKTSSRGGGGRRAA